MTTYIPFLTLPSQAFSKPAIAILLPIVSGTTVGFLVSPKGKRNTYAEYLALKQPPYNPPPWVFGPVWTLLYGLMGFSAYRAWTAGRLSPDPLTRGLAMASQGATLYTIQLGLNLIWTPLFFYFRRPIESAIDIIALTGTTTYLALTWGKVDAIAGWALVPYLAWLSFASYLAVGVGYLNHWNTSQLMETTSLASEKTQVKSH
ncbi:MAG: hypothetical protein M1829_002425 [Trizodia sp. TS-e1964]|nr:MAG: hypothetical protein M1829_002425 [Trizodia sp. TS-e1964]